MFPRVVSASNLKSPCAVRTEVKDTAILEYGQDVTDASSHLHSYYVVCLNLIYFLTYAHVLGPLLVYHTFYHKNTCRPCCMGWSPRAMIRCCGYCSVWISRYLKESGRFPSRRGSPLLSVSLSCARKSRSADLALAASSSFGLLYLRYSLYLLVSARTCPLEKLSIPPY